MVTELDGRDWSQALALSRNEKGKRRSLIASGLTPFSFTVSAYCTNTDVIGGKELTIFGMLVRVLRLFRKMSR